MSNAPAQEEPPTCRIDDLLRFGTLDGSLDVTFTLPDSLHRDDPVSLRVEGSSATWSLTAPPSSNAIELSYRDPGDEHRDGHVRATVSRDATTTSIAGTFRRGHRSICVLYRTRHLDRSVSFEAYVMEKGSLSRTIINARAASFADLWSAQPATVQTYLAPILRKLARRNVLGAGPADIFAAFPPIPADANTVAAL